MIVVGLGIDLIEVETIRRSMRHDEQCASAWCTQKELDWLGVRSTEPSSVAVYVAGKEAVAKALGTGLSGDIAWQDIEMAPATQGEFKIVLLAGAIEAAHKAGIKQVSLCVTRGRKMIMATALAIG